MTFGNGFSEQYEYDALDNLSSLCYNNSSTPAFTWTYDISGLLKSRYDAASRITETYEYDSYSRLSSSTLKQTVDVYDEYEYEPSGTASVTRLTTTYAYDNYGRNSSVGYAFANKSYTRSVTYGLSDRIDSYTISGALQKVNSYDALNRLSGVSLKNASNSEVIGTSYSYIGMLPSSEISSFTEFYYTYDAANRITRIAEYGDDVACYTYDAQGQLIREDNAAANKTWIYTYDNYGNILTKSTYAFSTDDLEFLGSPSSVKTWSYTSSALGKQLSHVDYDAIGNPIFDGDRAWSYTWNGRLLTEIMGDGGSPIFRARYNQDGIRTYKEYAEDGNSFVRHDFVLEGSLILQEHAYSFYSSDPWEDPVTYYTNYYYYDENGSLVGLNYNGTNYYYYKNILGDILGILDSSGTLVVEYSYDAWGNIISTTGSMASTLGAANPFRYRGYYYDAETGFYYLNSRYYDPSACRFINSDRVLILYDAISCNLFSYCRNNPVMFIDNTGEACDFNVLEDETTSLLELEDIYGGSAYQTYRIRQKNAAHDAYIGGYHFAGFSSGVVHPQVYFSPGLITVTDRQGLSVRQIKMRKVTANGVYGEKLAQITGKKIRIYLGNDHSHFRVPDGIDVNNKVLIEVKNYTRTLYYTKQLRYYVQWAKQEGYIIHLYTNAELSGPLKKIVNSGLIKKIPLG